MKARTNKAGSARTPAHRRGAFTLIEMIAVLAIISVLATLMLPNFIKRIDMATRAQEAANLAAIHEALKLDVIRNATVPDENGWAQAVTRWSTIPAAKVTVNSRHYNRIYYWEEFPNPPEDVSSPYLYAQTTNGTSPPANLRALVVSTLGGANGPDPAGGELSAAEFNALWNTPDGARPSTGNWAAWTGTGDDFLIQRIDYAPLFHHLLLANRDAASTWFTINGSPIRLDRATNNAGWDAYYVEGTIVGLCDTDGDLLATHILTRDVSFVFEAGLWRSQIMGVYTGVAQADEFADEAADFMSSQWSGNRGADQQGVLTAMYSFMYVYTLWANQRPHFPMHGATDVQVTEYKMLRDIADNNARLDEFSSGLVD